ncbi:hypothetical protein Bbelb_043330 [Branchiostoma belcheri]|nr:hypothetical protein Bbelb_043330 [Branchiostoma belcheri]
MPQGRRHKTLLQGYSKETRLRGQAGASIPSGAATEEILHVTVSAGNKAVHVQVSAQCGNIVTVWEVLTIVGTEHVVQPITETKVLASRLRSTHSIRIRHL